MSEPYEYFVTFGHRYNLRHNYVRVQARNYVEAMAKVAEAIGRTVQDIAIFAYEIDDLDRQVQRFNLTEVPLETELVDESSGRP